MNLNRLLLTVAVVGALSCAANAEIVYLKTGGYVEGDVTTTADAVDVATPRGTLHLSKDDVAWVGYRHRDGRLGLETGERFLSVGLGGGIPLPAQGFHELAKTGLTTQVEGLVQVDPHWGVGVRADDTGFDYAYPQTSAASQKASVDASALVLEARYVFLAHARFSPFAAAGAGVNFFSEDLQTTSKTTGDMTDAQNASSGLAAELGGGLQYFPSARTIAELAARWHYDTVSKSDFGFTAAQSVSLLATIGWRF